MNKELKNKLDELLNNLTYEAEMYGDDQEERRLDNIYDLKAQITDLVSKVVEGRTNEDFNYIKIPKNCAPLYAAMALWDTEETYKNSNGKIKKRDIFSREEIWKIGKHLINMATIEGTSEYEI